MPTAADHKGLATLVAVHDEQINGERGLVKGMNDLVQQVRYVNRALWTIAVALIGGAGVIIVQLATGQ